jgi:hypothetical protein
MSKAVALFAVALTCLGWSAPPAVADGGPPPTLQELKDGLARRARTYSDGHFKFTVRTFNTNAPERVIRDLTFDLYKSGPKVRLDHVERTAGAKPGTDRVAWDGRRRTGYHESPTSPPVQRYNGTILGEADDIVRRQYYRAVTHDEEPTRNQPLAEIVEAGAWQVIGTKRVGPYAAWGLRNDGLVGGYLVDVELWVCPDHGFAPVEITEKMHFRSGKVAATTRLTEVELTQRGDRWVARKAHVVTLPTRPGSVEQVEEFELTEYAPTVPDGADFVVKFPVGAAVLDAARPDGKRFFIAGKCVVLREAGKPPRAFDIKLFPEYVALTDYSTGLTDEEYRSTSWARQVVEDKLE